jgi:hypothetical protein
MSSGRHIPPRRHADASQDDLQAGAGYGVRHDRWIL